MAEKPERASTRFIQCTETRREVSDLRDEPGLHCNNVPSHSYPAPPASPENEAKGMHTDQLFENISSDLSLLTSRLQFLYKRPRGDDHLLENLVSVDAAENSISVHGPLQKRPKCLETINESVFEEATARCILDSDEDVEEGETAESRVFDQKRRQTLPHAADAKEVVMKLSIETLSVHDIDQTSPTARNMRFNNDMNENVKVNFQLKKMKNDASHSDYNVYQKCSQDLYEEAPQSWSSSYASTDGSDEDADWSLHGPFILHCASQRPESFEE